MFLHSYYIYASETLSYNDPETDALFSVKRYIATLVNESPATSTLVMETVSKSINSNGRSYTRGRIIRPGG